jgi:hypothetical protein
MVSQWLWCWRTSQSGALPVRVLRLFVFCFPSFSVSEGLLLWGVGDGQEGGMMPPVLCDYFTVEDPYRYSYTQDHRHDTQGSEYRIVSPSY